MVLSVPAARFEIPAETVTVLHTPTEFRAQLVNGIQSCKHRCILTSLYIGAEQEEILSCIAKKAAENVKTWTMLDYSRTLRPDWDCHGNRACSADVMQRVWEKYIGQEDCASGSWLVKLYRSPCSYNWQRWFPYRMQETLGVLHWKFYVFDDNVIITGANVAASYLIDRHDRWILIRDNPTLCNALQRLFELWQGCCHTLIFDSSKLSSTASRVRGGGAGKWIHLAPPETNFDCCLANIADYLPQIQDFEEDCERNIEDTLSDKVRITLGIHCGYGAECVLKHTESAFMVTALRGPCLESSRKGSMVLMATPYCNVAEDTIRLLQRELKDQEVHIVGPSPMASSFFNGGPVLSAIPYAYQMLTIGVLESLTKHLKVIYSEFMVGEASSTFHAKGIWHVAGPAASEGSTGSDNSSSDAGLPRIITIAGSTNFGLRSQKRDMECLFLVDTCAPALIHQFQHEVHQIISKSRRCLSLDHLKAPIKSLNFLTFLISRFFATNSFFKSLL